MTIINKRVKSFSKKIIKISSTFLNILVYKVQLKLLESKTPVKLAVKRHKQSKDMARQILL